MESINPRIARENAFIFMGKTSQFFEWCDIVNLYLHL